jgi:hypothetical protein
MHEVAALVKKYRGSMSGEHGDGRVRGEFIPFMLGEKNYQFIKQVKKPGIRIIFSIPEKLWIRRRLPKACA